ncbi:MAG: hypothetical protein Kow0037_30450 [Calditrichia bacterium]
MKISKVSIVLILLFIAIGFSLGQLNEKDLFDQGLDQLKNGYYKQAQTTFLKLLKNYPDGTLLTASKLLLAESYYRDRDFKRAEIVCKNFINENKSSDYLDDIYELMGRLAFRKKQFTLAVKHWMWVIENGNDSRLKRKAADQIYKTSQYRLDLQQLEQLRKEIKNEQFEGLVELVSARQQIQSGRKEAGLEKLRNFLRDYPHHLFAEKAREIIRQNTSNQVTSNQILILKSSQSDLKEIYDHLAEGMIYAADEMNTRFPQKSILLDTLTFSPGILNLLKTTENYLEKQNPLAIVGPLQSDEMAALSLLSHYESIPLVAPTSTEKGLTDLSEYLFQINPTPELKGKLLGEYAVNELKLKTFAILAPANAYGEQISRSFEKAVIDNGGEVVEIQWFYEGAQDFSRQFKQIRKKGFYIAFRDSVLAEDSTLTDEVIQEQFKTYLTEQLFSNQNVRGSIDSTQIASTGIDGLFIALFPEDIPYLAPQFAFHNIDCQLLGNEGWNDPDLLYQHRPYIDGIVYVTAGYLDRQSWNYNEFTARFRKKMKTTPDRYHLLGYDIGKWMMQQYEPDINRLSYRNKLLDSGEYQGIFGKINIDRELRVNTQLNIVKFKMGQLLKLK